MVEPGGRVASIGGHVGLLGDLERVGRCLVAVGGGGGRGLCWGWGRGRKRGYSMGKPNIEEA